MSESNIVTPSKAGFLKFMQEVRSGRETDSKLTKRDEGFAIIAELDGWKEFKALADRRIERLKSLRDYDAAGKDLNELGLRFLVADIVAGEIESLISRVDQARDLYEQEARKKDNASQ